MIFPLALLALGLVMFPFYVFHSGVPQPAHVVLFASATLSILSYRRSSQLLSSDLAVALIAFVGYVVVINLINGLYFNGVEESMTYASYYVFNGFVFLGVSCLGLTFVRAGRTELFWSVILVAMLCCLTMQTAIGLLDIGRSYASYRSILYFNNPNQLGYFAVGSCAILFLIQRYRRGSQLWNAAGYVMAIYLAALSVSKAAFLSILSVPAVHLIGGGGVSARRLAAIAVAFAAIVVGADFVGDDLTNNLSRRLSTIGEQDDDSLEGRGYLRIVEYPEYLVFGAGEGIRAARFSHRQEIHSAPATLLFSYGVVGTMLFGYFLFLLYRRAGLLAMAHLIPFFLYNLTHNGFRSPLLWTVMALVFVGAMSDASPARRSSPRHSTRRRVAGTH